MFRINEFYDILTLRVLLFIQQNKIQHSKLEYPLLKQYKATSPGEETQYIQFTYKQLSIKKFM